MAEVSEGPPAAADLPPFSGDAAMCEKCHYTDIGTKYRDTRCTPTANGVHHSALPLSGGRPEWEHLHRQCRRCGYSWDEALT